MADDTPAAENGKNQFIVARIGREQYGIDIHYVNHVVRMQKIVRVPKVQPYFKGIINLRGEIIPVMSIRAKMGLEPDEFTDVTRIVILKLEEHEMLGIIVDEVKEAAVFAPDEIEEVSYEVKGKGKNFFCGVGKNGGQLISLLDINNIIDETENV